MSNGGPKPARPIFRKLAGGVAIVCFVVGGVAAVANPNDGLFGPGVCLFVGFIMSVIAVTGYWPPRRA
jgi:hypothetical protein